MGFKDKHTSATKNETGKIKLSDEAYAMCEILEGILVALRK